MKQSFVNNSLLLLLIISKTTAALLLLLICSVIVEVSEVAAAAVYTTNSNSVLFSPSYTWYRRKTRKKVDDKDVGATIPLETITTNHTFHQVYKNFNTRPAWKAPKFIWRYSFKLHTLAMKVFLHRFDTLTKSLPNSSLSLQIVWWKALQTTNVIAAAWSYDLLPTYSRWIVGRRIFKFFFPPLSSANIDLRTSFIDTRINDTIKQVRDRDPNTSIRLVTLGAGYDLRSVRLLNTKEEANDGEDNMLKIQSAIEIDLETVVQGKKMLLESKRFQRRRPNCILPETMVGIDLNEDSDVLKSKLDLILNGSSSSKRKNVFTIFVLEGILVHLESGSSSRVLEVLSTILKKTNDNRDNNNNNCCCLIFADCIEGITNRSLQDAKCTLHKTGWELIEFVANPTRAPHFGVAYPN